MSTMELAAGGLLRPAPGLALSGLHSSWTQRSAGIVAWHQPSVPCCRSCSPPCCSAGDVVFQLGAPADEMYIVERGQGEGWPAVGAPGSPCLVLHRAVAARLYQPALFSKVPHSSPLSLLPLLPFLPCPPQWSAASTSMPPRCTAGRSCRRCPLMRGPWPQSEHSSTGLAGCLASLTSSCSGPAGQ